MSVLDLPYSKASRSLFPLWEELAEAVKEREDVVIARIDASANDINLSMQGSYPSLCLFPALYAERVRFQSDIIPNMSHTSGLTPKHIKCLVDP